VKVIVTRLNPRADLPDLGGSSGLHVYLVPDPLARAMFIADSGAVRMQREAIHQRLRSGPIDLAHRIMLPGDSFPATLPAVAATAPADFGGRVRYQRVSSDEIALAVESDQPGWVRVLETFDPGWKATLDGAASSIHPAEDVFLAVHVPRGTHRIILRYHTPGAMAGMAMSGISLLLLVGLWSALARPGSVPGRRAESRDGDKGKAGEGEGDESAAHDR
jgi:hypothetical protein